MFGHPEYAFSHMSQINSSTYFGDSFSAIWRRFNKYCITGSTDWYD